VAERVTFRAQSTKLEFFPLLMEFIILIFSFCLYFEEGTASASMERREPDPEHFYKLSDKVV